VVSSYQATKNTKLGFRLMTLSLIQQLL